MHRATEKSELTDSADGSIARRAQLLRSATISRAATSALTKCAFSWKFAPGFGIWQHTYGGRAEGGQRDGEDSSVLQLW